MAIIEKVLNSSVVLAKNSKNEEVIILGKGIGYGKKPGQEVESGPDERVFIPLKSKDGNQLKEILDEIPADYLEVCHEIVTYAEHTLGTTLNKHVYLALTDHLFYAVQRKEKNINILNKLYWNVLNFYPKEFSVGVYGIKCIKEKTGVELSEEEAANIAFHIINASKQKESNYDAIRASKLIKSIVTTVTYYMKIDMDHSSINYTRFINHLQFFVERFFADEMLDGDSRIYRLMMEESPQAIECAERIRTLTQKEYNKFITDEEVAYLAVHIHRICSR